MAILCFCMGFHALCSAQPDSVRLHVYSLDIGSLVDHVNTSARFSYEYRSATRWGFTLGMGYVYNLYSWRFTPDAWSVNRGYLPSFELRHYNPDTDAHELTQFWGLRFHYLESHMTKDFTFTHEDPPLGYPGRIEGDIYQYKQTYGVHFIFGENMQRGNWLVEYTAGIGAIHRTLDYALPDGYYGPERTALLRKLIANNPFDGVWPSLYLQFRLRRFKQIAPDVPE